MEQKNKMTIVEKKLKFEKGNNYCTIDKSFENNSYKFP